MNLAPAAVELRGVWRRYRVASPRRPRGLRASISRDPLRRRPDRWRWALRGVDLDVGRGEAVGVIGRNGAGKSTLLRLAGGVGRPDRGTVAATGRIGALIDLGQELHGDLTGRQNAELAGVVAGLTRREVRRRLGEIVAFAELEEHVDQPLRAYSDGMRARLAFSVMAHLDPDVLLVDEVLSVGDAPFQRRSLARIDELRSRGAAVLLVSHDLAQVRRVCQRAIWLDHGEVVAGGHAPDVVARYLDATSPERAGPGQRTGPGGGIGQVRVLDEWGAAATTIGCGDGLIIEVDLAARPASPEARLGIRIVRAGSGVVVVDTSSPADTRGPSTVRVHFERLDLAPGDHQVEVGLYAPDWSATLDRAEPVPLALRGDGPDTAALAPPHRWSRAPIAHGEPDGIRGGR